MSMDALQAAAAAAGYAMVLEEDFRDGRDALDGARGLNDTAQKNATLKGAPIDTGPTQTFSARMSEMLGSLRPKLPV